MSEATGSSAWKEGLDTFSISLAGSVIQVQRAANDFSTGNGQLLKAEDGRLFIDVLGDGTSLVAIVSDYGGTPPTFDSASSWSDSYSSGSWSQESIAVEQLSDGSFKLAVKNTNTYDGNTTTDWVVYNISNSGVLDWNASYGGITKFEEDFNQDLNDDGVIGVTTLISVDSDSTGARLKRDPDNGLYIDVNNDGTNIIAIENEYGGSPTFDSSSSWSDPYSSGSWSQESIAVEQQPDGSFKLAIKDTNINNGATDINWSVYSISSAGVLDWSGTWGGISKHEADFNQDLNGDGGIGLTAALKSVETDTTGARLKRDTENGLYIDVNNDGTNVIAIEDNYGGTPTFDNSNSWSDGSYTSSYSQESVAVEQQSDGSFKLAVKDTNTYNGTTDINWSVYSISSAGVLDWSSTWGGISKREADFNQDLNGDGGIGLTAALQSVETDTTGARLKRDTENGLYIDVNNDGTNVIAIEDNHGGTPTFDNSNSWSDGSYTSSYRRSQ